MSVDVKTKEVASGYGQRDELLFLLLKRIVELLEQIAAKG